MGRPSSLDERSTVRGDRGETLIELMVAVMILSTAVVALVGAIALTVRVSDIHRKQATAGASVRAFAEALATKVAATPTGYHDATCATPANYTGMYTAPTGFTATVTAVKFWSGSAFVATCPDNGVQLVSLSVASNDGRASETLDVVLRKPCRQGETCA
jgi:Tfp pilus assembly protein PilV